MEISWAYMTWICSVVYFGLSACLGQTMDLGIKKRLSWGATVSLGVFLFLAAASGIYHEGFVFVGLTAFATITAALISVEHVLPSYSRIKSNLLKNLIVFLCRFAFIIWSYKYIEPGSLSVETEYFRSALFVLCMVIVFVSGFVSKKIKWIDVFDLVTTFFVFGVALYGNSSNCTLLIILTALSMLGRVSNQIFESRSDLVRYLYSGGLGSPLTPLVVWIGIFTYSINKDIFVLLALLSLTLCQAKIYGESLPHFDFLKNKTMLQWWFLGLFYAISVGVVLLAATGFIEGTFI